MAKKVKKDISTEEEECFPRDLVVHEDYNISELDEYVVKYNGEFYKDGQKFLCLEILRRV